MRVLLVKPVLDFLSLSSQNLSKIPDMSQVSTEVFLEKSRPDWVYISLYLFHLKPSPEYSQDRPLYVPISSEAVTAVLRIVRYNPCLNYQKTNSTTTSAQFYQSFPSARICVRRSHRHGRKRKYPEKTHVSEWTITIPSHMQLLLILRTELGSQGVRSACVNHYTTWITCSMFSTYQ